MNFAEEDYEQMAYPIYGLSPKESVLKLFPELSRIPEFKKGIGVEKDKAVRFIIYMFDPQSPLSTADNAQGQCTYKALELSGFALEEKGYHQGIEDMVEFKDENFVAMVIAFLRSFYSIEWSNFKVQERIYYDLVKQAFKDPSKTDSNKMSQAVTNLGKSRVEFLKNSNNKRLIELVYQQAYRENLEISPELIALKRSEGKEIFPDVSASTN